MPKYDNVNRIITPGNARSSTSINPKMLLEDITEKIHTLRPEATPFDSLMRGIGRGPKPISPKVQVMQYHGFDNYDYCSAVTLGSTVPNGGYERFARLTLTQPSRYTTNSSMWYQPQDRFFIVATKQVVEVVATPVDTIRTTVSTKATFPALLTGDTTTTTAAGTVVVRNLDPAPILPFTTSDIIYIGNALFQSQKIETVGHERDVLFDCNFVEHNDATFQITEDQKNWIKTRGTIGDWEFNQQKTIEEFKITQEYKYLFSKRSVDLTIPGRPKYTMDGLFNTIQTNVAVYNPDNITDWEVLMANFVNDQAFRYNPYGTTKIGLAGKRFVQNFNLYFRDQRRLTQSTPGGKIGLNFDSYQFGGFTLNLTRTDALRGPLEDWCFVVDVEAADMRVVKDYATRLYANNDERDVKFMIEWQGTVAWNLEQAHALIRTA